MAKVTSNAGDSEAEEVEFRGYTFKDGKSVDVKDADLHHFQQGNPYFEVSGEKATEPASQQGQQGQTPPAGEPNGPFTTKDAGSGWWVILDKDSKQVGNKIRKDYAEEFAKMSAEDQAEYLK